MTTDTTAPQERPADLDAETDHAHHHGYIGDKKAYLRRMSRIEGQARGISRMIDEEQYCIDILTQVSALTLDDHLKHCVMDAAKSGDEEEAAAKLKEAGDAIARLLR
jgi:DNA-binding FrmR family transcriptional regulator